jgi:hypothetical protein
MPECAEDLAPAPFTGGGTSSRVSIVCAVNLESEYFMFGEFPPLDGGRAGTSPAPQNRLQSIPGIPQGMRKQPMSCSLRLR